MWDTVRTVRCLWEGNINKALTVSLSVDMLNQEIVTFSGDTATAKLDIQMGKGPFAPAANGLVKIGETMTLVVSVEGDPGFDLQVSTSLGWPTFFIEISERSLCRCSTYDPCKLGSWLVQLNRHFYYCHKEKKTMAVSLFSS